MRIRLAATALLLTSIASQAQVMGTTPVIEAAGLAITKADFEKMFEGDPRLRMANERPEAKLALGTDVGKAFALEAEARNRQLDQLPAVQLKVRNYTTQLLAQELLISVRKGYLKDEATLKALYEKDKQSFEEPRVRQIMVRFQGSEAAAPKGKRQLTREQALARAQALLARLNNGANFAALAKAESDDIGSRASGGDIGFVAKATTDAAFEDVAYSLPIGKISSVVQTKYGYHIVRVEERRPMAFDAVKGILANSLAHKDLDAIILNGYKLNMAYFGK